MLCLELSSILNLKDRFDHHRIDPRQEKQISGDSSRRGFEETKRICLLHIQGRPFLFPYVLQLFSLNLLISAIGLALGISVSVNKCTGIGARPFPVLLLRYWVSTTSFCTKSTACQVHAWS